MRLLISLTLLLASARAFGQGYIFTWHGSTNLFQASFQVTDAEMQPGARWNSPLFLGSMSVTNISGNTYHGGDASSSGTGGVYADGSGWFLTFQLNDFTRGTEVLVSSSVIHEKPFSGPDTYFEPGSWTYAPIPEPSPAALGTLALGVSALRRKNRTASASPRSRIMS